MERHVAISSYQSAAQSFAFPAALRAIYACVYHYLAFLRGYKKNYFQRAHSLELLILRRWQIHTRRACSSVKSISICRELNARR